VKRARECVRRLRESRSWHDEVLADQLVHLLVADSRHRRERGPHRLLSREVVRLEHALSLEFNDHVRSAGNQRLVRRLNRLARGVGEYVAAAGDLEDLVQKPDTAARIDFAQRFRLSSDDQQYAGPGTSELQITVPLSAVTKVLKRSQIEGREQQYSLDLTTSGQSIDQISLGQRSGNAPPERGNFLKIMFQRPGVDNAAAANRMADAMNHIVELCRASAPANK